GIQAWEEGWWEMSSAVGDTLGEILGAGPGTITMHQNVSVAQAIIASALEPSGRRNKIVYTDMNFPSVMYVWEAHVKYGARVAMVSSDDGITIDTQRLVDAIDEETLVVPISHVLFRSSFIQDVPAVVEKANRVGALVILDCYQSAGTVPIHLEDLGVHFAVGGSIKWLLGGPGAGYLYVRRDLIDRFEPAITGWAAHARPFDFATGPNEYAPGIARWSHGTPSVAPLYQCLPGYEMIRSIGVERIRAKSMRQTARMLEKAGEKGMRLNSPADPRRRGGSVVIDVPQGYAVCQELIRRGFLVDYRPGAGVRMAPHFYNTDDECDATIEEMATIVAVLPAGASPSSGAGP
ncbi:MAG: aminotransferase class V-fold PLP-dependent enzyme, partial [Acidobacteriota bacterium]